MLNAITESHINLAAYNFPAYYINTKGDTVRLSPFLFQELKVFRVANYKQMVYCNVNQLVTDISTKVISSDNEKNIHG